MKTPLFFILVFLWITSCKHNQKEEAGKVKDRPNVLLIIADDLGYTDLGTFGSSFYDTPNLDALAQNAVKFTNGYANCPVCSPSRAAIQTGKFPVRTGVTDWIKGRKAFQGTTPNDRWIVPDTDFEMKLEESTIAENLKKGGYSTAFIGKWHLGEQEEFWPEHQGYDINVAGWSMGRPNTGKDINGYFSPFGNPRLKDGPEGEYLTDRLTAETMAILDTDEFQGNPFFVCLSYYSVHGPLMAKDKDIATYEVKRADEHIDERTEFLDDLPWMEAATGNPKGYKERVVQGHPTYAAMVHSLDENIGKVIQHLKEIGQYDNTLILFISDNGGLSTKEGSPTSNLPLAKGKGWMYEGGIRVPLLIKAPGQQKGKVLNEPVTGADFYPTILDYAQLDIPNPSEIDGKSLKASLDLGEEIRERPLFWHYPHYGNQGGNPSSAVRLGDFKLIHDLELDSYELFNLAEDIGETRNLAEMYPKKTATLKELLHEWLEKNYHSTLLANPEWTKVDLKLNTTR
ncbi:sulfatase [Flagellimonas sp. MMG031]|uniref:Sulfatase n=1 Tax=Flagellimonas sp. MMG031 TaxID=3158549 RepID=A0AAU7MWW3_9FLAO